MWARAMYKYHFVAKACAAESSITLDDALAMAPDDVGNDVGSMNGDSSGSHGERNGLEGSGDHNTDGGWAWRRLHAASHGRRAATEALVQLARTPAERDMCVELAVEHLNIGGSKGNST